MAQQQEPDKHNLKCKPMRSHITAPGNHHRHLVRVTFQVHSVRTHRSESIFLRHLCHLHSSIKSPIFTIVTITMLYKARQERLLSLMYQLVSRMVKEDLCLVSHKAVCGTTRNETCGIFFIFYSCSKLLVASIYCDISNRMSKSVVPNLL